ncbi:MAG: hypothetical protein Q8R39_02125 [bacterium]|nr:hypothetical protein [bacterium]MDZ4284207.1 hypothetical protein [Patescibacteria group bacterium]
MATVKRTLGSKKLSSRAMHEVTGAACFWVNNGPILCSLRDLHTALGVMTKKQFEHHARAQHNDFASWAEGVFADKALALRLRRAKTPAGMRKALAAYL